MTLTCIFWPNIFPLCRRLCPTAVIYLSMVMTDLLCAFGCYTTSLWTKWTSLITIEFQLIDNTFYCNSRADTKTQICGLLFVIMHSPQHNHTHFCHSVAGLFFFFLCDLAASKELSSLWLSTEKPDGYMCSVCVCSLCPYVEYVFQMLWTRTEVSQYMYSSSEKENWRDRESDNSWYFCICV